MPKKTDEIKYTLLPKKRVRIENMHRSRRLYQIQALRDIPRHGIKAGDLGGYVERRNILSQSDDCWIKEGSVVTRDRYNPAYVLGNALIDGQYVIHGSVIKDNVVICGGKGLIDRSKLENSTKIEGNIYLCGTEISGFSSIKCITPPFGIAEDFDSLLDRINLIDSEFKDINLSGDGSIYKVKSHKSFEVSGYFSLAFFVDSGGEAVTLTKPFKAHGEIEADWAEFNDTLVELSGKISLDHVYFSEGPVYINGGTLKNCQVRGLIDIEGNVEVEDSFLKGENYLRDTVQITGAQLKGRNILSGDAKVDHGIQIENQVISHGLVVPENNGKTRPSLYQNGITTNITANVSPVAEIAPVADLGNT